jgi:hypothetical protein
MTRKKKYLYLEPTNTSFDSIKRSVGKRGVWPWECGLLWIDCAKK